MFKELVPILRDRAVLLTVTLLDADQIRVNIVPKKIKDGDNDALTIPLSVTGTAEELDSELPSTIIGFVGSHLQMKNTLEKAKAEMDAASKAAQAEARAKSKAAIGKKELPKTDPAQLATTAKPVEPAKPELPKIASLFDDPTPAPASIASAEPKEAPESYAQFAEVDDDDEPEESAELDEVA